MPSVPRAASHRFADTDTAVAPVTPARVLGVRVTKEAPTVLGLRPGALAVTGLALAGLMIAGTALALAGAALRWSTKTAR